MRKLRAVLAMLPLAALLLVTPSSAGADTTCVQLPGHHDYSCIVPGGYTYYWKLAEANVVYGHPLPATDYTFIEGYFKDSSVGLPPAPSQMMRRPIALADGAIPVNWDVNANDNNPPPPTECTTWYDHGPAGPLANVKAGTLFPCPPNDVTTIMDNWERMGPVSGDW